MPEAFDSCVKRGGRVRMKSLKGGKLIPICFIDGESHVGEVRARKKHKGKLGKALLAQKKR